MEDSTASRGQTEAGQMSDNKKTTPHLVPPRSGGEESRPGATTIHGLTGEDNERLVRQVTEAATAAAVAAHDAVRGRKLAAQQAAGHQAGRVAVDVPKPVRDELADAGLSVEPMHAGGAHDAPNWSKSKSSIVLLGATILYAVIAEILVNTVDVVLESVDIDEKFLGITLFSLVPNTTEFLVR